MDKIHNYWQKVIAAAFVLAIASVGAPQGAHAASWLDGVLDNPNSYGEAKTTGNTTGTINDVYGDFQLAAQHTRDASPANATKTCLTNALNLWGDRNTDPTYKEAMVQTTQNSWDSGLHELRWLIGNGTATSGSFSLDAGSTSGFGALLSLTGGNWAYRINISTASGSGGGLYMESTTTPGKYIGITCQTSQNINVGNSLFKHTKTPGFGTPVYPLWYRGITINYPGGYVGSPVRENYVAPIAPVSDTPKIVLRGVVNWEGEFSDDNFLTFDEVPFTCEEGLAPVIEGEVWDERGTPVILDTFVASATGLFNIRFPEDSSDSDYRIVAWYVCDDGVNFFSDSSHYTFTITGYGQLKNEDLFAACVDASFPFLHLNNCLENMFTVINLLKFGDTNFGGNWNSPAGCYTLTYIDDWINRPGQVVCPAVKGTVRTLMTPVVLFLLALAMVRVVNRQNERRP